MPKQKAKKEKTINELEEDTLNSATSSTNESFTLFEGHEKPSHEVDPPAPMQQQLQQNISLMSCQDIKKEFSIKQELLDGMYYNSKNQQGQLLDTTETNILESGRVFTPENHDSSIKIKTEKAASVIVKDDSKKISAMELKQELNTNTYFRKLEKPKDAHTLSEDLTFVSLSEPIINDAAKLDSQGHSKIVQELLACECIPSPGKLRLNSTVKVDSTFNEIELSTINADFTSDNSIPLLGTKTEKNCIPESENSNLHQFLLSSDPLTNDTEDISNGSAPSDLQNLESIIALSNEQIHVSSIEQIHVSNIEHLKNNITTSSENIHTEVYQDAGVINKEVMSNISSTCLDHSSPTFSSTCSLFDNDSNICCKTSSKIKEVEIDTEINSSTSGSAVFDNSMLSNENFHHGGNQTSTYSDVFVRSWGHVDSSNSEVVVSDISVFSELGTHLRLLGYQLCKNEAIKTFGKKALKEHENNKKLTIDHLFLEKLFPTEVPENSEENKLEEKLAKFCLPTSVPASIVEVECKTQNLENKIAQTGLQNANSCFEPEVEKITYMDLQDTDSSFESIVKKITQMDSQNANNYMDCEAEKRGMNSEGIFKHLDVQALKDILKNFPNNSNDNLKDSTYETESCLASNLSLIENNPSYTQLISSSAVFDDDEAKKQSPSNTNQLHNTGHGLQEDSDDSCVDNSRAENSDDSDSTVKNLSFEKQLNPQLPPKKKKIDNQDAEFVPRKKSRYEIIMERKEQEKLLKVVNYCVEKSMSLHNTSSQLSTNSKQHKDLEIFHPTSGKLPSLQKKDTPKSKKDDTSKEKAKPVTEKTKMDTHDKKKKDEKSNHSGFSEMDAGMRFTNRNSSLFEGITKVAQQPVPCRPRPVPQENAKSNTNHFTMEEIHAQIDTNLISLPEPQKKKPSVKYYSSHNKALSSAPLNRDMLHTKSRVLPPSTQPFPASHLIRDPRLIRRQSDDSSPNLKYIRSYQPNAMTQSENVLQFNNFMRTSTSFSPPNSDYNIWNNSLSNENHVLPTMGPVPKLMNAYLLHSNRSSSPTNPSFLSPSQTASFDDMDLCDSEPPIPPVQFRSSHRTQNFDSTRSYSSSSYLRDPRLLPTSSHYSGSPLASAMMSSSNVNLPGPRSEDSPYDINVSPLRLSQSVGQTVMSVPQALMVILSWIPDWIKEVNRSNQKVTPPLWRNATALREARPCYEDMAEHFTTVFPLMLFDLFFRMCEMHKSMKDKNANTYVLDFVKFEIVDDIMDIKAEIVLSAGKPHFTIKGQLAVLTFALTSGKKKDVFGFITNQYIYLNTAIRQEVLHLHIKLVCNVQGFNKKEKISVFPFYPLSKFLSQIDALVSIDISPLRNIILKPSAPACARIVLERFGDLAENVHIVNRAIEKIKDGISLNEPEEPRILIIDSPLGTDLMSTLIGVIEDVNKFETPFEKQPILICTRTMKQLVNITSRLNSTGGKESACPMLNTTILVKMNKIPDPKLKELTLEYKISKCKKSGKRKSSTSQEQLPEDSVHKEAKTEILKNSDVVLSHIPQSYDSSIKMLFGIGKALQFAFCIVDQAYTFTEPEVSLPLSYGIKKLILAGDSKEKPRVVSEVSAEHKYYQPLPSRLSLSIVSDS